ncbi:hypothetical protein GNIT_2158 [Glaciecola nitratireducens FR1064]|uniref:Uncharacterized protein n=1 Tax=Glaciecola nitratireducens (strain JCM 12485 / KCTC 12276 / FR1064) TaxID=1085623 RepID=G4QHN4_GLANF|nr:hypothetical protein GNIT_2158 [Glaciecola nitratireducens FR1064]
MKRNRDSVIGMLNKRGSEVNLDGTEINIMLALYLDAFAKPLKIYLRSYFLLAIVTQ